MALSKEAQKRAQELRSERYKIGIKAGGNVTKPGEFEHLADDQFADPVNYRYPIDEAHIRAALSYWGMPKNKEPYTSDEQDIISGRIEKAAEKFEIGRYAKASLGLMIPLAEGREVPEEQEVQVAPLGYHERMSIPTYVDEDDVDRVVKAFDARGIDVVVDYDHDTIMVPPGTRKPAAGWIRRLIDKGSQGLWAVVRWTDKAREVIGSREYRYLSPVFPLDDKSHPLELHSVALVNKPAIAMPALAGEIFGMNNFSRKEDEMELIERLRKLFSLGQAAGEDDVFAACEEAAGRTATTKILEALGIASDSEEAKDEAKIIETIKTSAGHQVAHPDVMKALALGEDASITSVTGAIVKLQNLSSGADDLSKRVVELETKGKETRRDELVKRATEEGKITAAQLPWAEKMAFDDPDGFEAFLKDAPVVVSAGELARTTKKTENTGSEIPDDTQLKINRMLGVGADDFTKYGPKEDAVQ